jgi:helix-turn-helix protein
MKSPSERRPMSLTEAAELWPMPRSTAFDLARRGKFPCRVIKAGRRYYVPIADFEEVVPLKRTKTATA